MLQVPILIEPIEGDRFRARAGEPFAMTVEADTRLAAYQELEKHILERLRAGAELYTLEVRLTQPQMLVAGCARGDPFFEELQQIIAENRRKEDAGQP
jgi:hypothetical protein